MLSEKAKGKQRAIEPPVEQNISAQCSSADHVKTKDTPRDLLVRFTEGAPDLIISVDKKDSVRDIKQRVHILGLFFLKTITDFFCDFQIRETRQELTNRRLRLIHSGRLLTDGIFLYSWLTSLEERQRRAHTDDEGPGAADIAAAAATAATTWIHCSVGPAMTSDEQKDEEQLQVVSISICCDFFHLAHCLVQTTQIQPVRGFDRLASVGFSQEDIDNIRRQFHDQSSANLLDHDFDTEEECKFLI